MSKEINISKFVQEENELFKRLNKGQENLINSRRQKLFKRTQMINSFNDYYKQLNNFNNIYKINHKKLKNKIETISNNYSIKKELNNIDESKSRVTLNTVALKNKAKKIKISHLEINSYDKKGKLYLPYKLKKKFDKKNNTISNFEKREKKKEENKNENNDTSNSKRRKSEIRLKLFNLDKIKYKGRSKSISFNNFDNNKNFLSYLELSSKKINKKDRKIRTQIFRINNLPNLNKNNNKRILIKKLLLKNKCSTNFFKNCICEKILNNPNLKLLYQTNENRIKNMIKSQSKKNKKKLTILKYQNNLIKNTISPLTEIQKNKLMKSFKKINNYVEGDKKMNICKYLREIQKKEKKIINSNNDLNEEYIKKIREIGLSSEKYILKIEKIEFKDIFDKKN